MIEIKLKNPDTGQFEECSVSTLTTPRLINGVEFDGSKDIDINEKEIAIQSEVPTDDGNKLWISGIQGSSSSGLTIDWVNITNKPAIPIKITNIEIELTSFILLDSGTITNVL